MSLTVNNSVGSFSSAASITQTISIPAGHTVGVVIFANFPSSPAIGTVTDSAGNTYTLGNTATIYGVYIMGTAYSLAIGSAITSVTYTPGGGGTATVAGMIVWDVTATGTISVGGTAANGYPGNAPGTTNGVTTGSITVTSSDGLILAGFNDHSSTGSTVGTGFTQDVSYNSALLLGEHLAVSTSTAGTFTATANDQVLVAGLSFQVASAGGAITSTTLSATAATAALAGAGALHSTGVSETTVTAALAGKGALNATSLAATASVANLAGTYALSAAGISLSIGTGSLAGAAALGALGASTTAATANAANLSAGAMAATAVSQSAAAASLSGVGALAASALSQSAVTVSTAQTIAVSMTALSQSAATATLTGISALCATGICISAATASSSGAAALGAVGSSATAGIVTLSAAGTLAQLYAQGISASAAAAALGASATQPAGRHHKRFVVEDGARRLWFSTKAEAEATKKALLRTIAKNHAKPRKIRVREVKHPPIEVIAGRPIPLAKPDRRAEEQEAARAYLAKEREEHLALLSTVSRIIEAMQGKAP